MSALIAAALWGLAEATFFFLVPDVLLSAIAVHDSDLAFCACAAAVAGALAGGALMYAVGRRRRARTEALLLRIPGVSVRMLERVRSEVASRGLAAVLLGPLSGTPYKLYAVAAARQGLSFTGFLLVSVPARGLRFVAVALLAAWLAHGVFPDLPAAVKYGTWAAAWIVFYAWYFAALRRRG